MPLQEFGATAALAATMMSLMVWLIRRLVTSQAEILMSQARVADQARQQIVEMQRGFMDVVAQLSASLHQLSADIKRHDEQQLMRDREILEALRKLNGHGGGLRQ